MTSITQYLDNRKINYKTSGKNTSPNWVEIKCVFPACNDPSTHLGINLTSGIYNCWACGSKGHIEKIIKEIDGCSANDAYKIANDLLLNSQKRIEIISQVDLVELPKEATKEFPKLHLDYLKKRRYNPNYVIKKYNLYACHQVGEFSYRIIIPIYMNNKLISFVAKDVTDKQKVPYKNLLEEKSIFSVKESLYEIDAIKNKVVIVEGPLDQWRIGNGSVCTFGTQFTHSQIHILAEKRLEEVIILYDFEDKAIKQAKKLANILSLFINKVEVWELNQGDPDTMDQKDLMEVKKWLK